jgi:transposase
MARGATKGDENRTTWRRHSCRQSWRQSWLCPEGTHAFQAAPAGWKAGLQARWVRLGRACSSPTLQQLQRAKPETVERFFREHNSRSETRIQERTEAIRSAVAAVEDTALLEAGAAATASLVALLKTLNDSIASFDRQIAELFPKHPEADLFAGLPGAGPVLLPRLLVAFGTRRERFQSASELAAYSGIAPVTKQSGKSKSIHFRRACSAFLRQTFHQFAAHSVAKSQWARQFYDQQRDKGKRHHAVVRSLAFKWIRVLFRCWQDRTPYDEARYLEALQRRRGPDEQDQIAKTDGRD